MGLDRVQTIVTVATTRKASMKLSTPISSCAALGLVAGLSLISPAGETVPASAAETAHISEIAYTLDSDFIEVAAEPGTDLSGWTIGSVTRGGSVHAPEHAVEVPAGTTIGESGALAIEVPITNSVKSGSAADGSYGASAFAVDDAGSLVSFDQIGGVVEGRGVTGKANTFTPEPVVGEDATPTGATAESGGENSIQLIDGRWQSASATPNALPDGRSDDDGDGSGEDPAPKDVTPIADIQGTGDESPLVGETVTTRGVVTASYPTGGLNGYYVQTPGTGGDETPGASDGIFVYSPDTVGEVNIGDHVELSGSVSEHYGQTQINVPASGLHPLQEPAEAVKPVDGEFPTDPAEREALEGMLVQPTSELTVADTYNTNKYGEVLLATGDGTLPQPTDVARPGSEKAKALDEENLAREVALDDGSTVNFLEKDQDVPLPYVSHDQPVRVGAQATITSPVVLGFGHEKWRFQPTTRLTGDNAAAVQPANFENTRTRAPGQVGGQVSLASFNVLNYFTTLGTDLPGCTFYTDRDGNPVTVRGGCDARGAANEESFERQEAKIVAAINSLDASVVSLMEIENSAHFGQDRDAALEQLVSSLNEAAGTQKWAFAPSPTDVPSDEDVIRSAFIYQPAEVAVEGQSTIHDDEDAFSNAREPLAQAFAPKDARGEVETEKTFIAIANHFKSKGSGSGPGNEDAGDGQGASNADRVKQAKSLVDFAAEQKDAASTDYVYLMGDFNSYTQEDPMQVFYDAGYANVGAEHTDESTYLYKNRVGSLDHVLALDTAANAGHAEGKPGHAGGEPGRAKGEAGSTAGQSAGDLPTSAFAAVTGADVWNINSVEALALEYSRHNYNATQFYEPDQFRASDHDPVLVGLFEPEDEAPGTDAEADTAGGLGANGDDAAGTDEASAEADASGSSSTAGAGTASAGTAGVAGNGGAEGSSGSGNGSSADSGRLPRTGGELGLPVSIAAGLLLVGAASAAITRRRQSEPIDSDPI